MITHKGVFSFTKLAQQQPTRKSTNRFSLLLLFFFFNDTATTEIYTLSLHDALPISGNDPGQRSTGQRIPGSIRSRRTRSEEHTSELQSRENIVCRLLLEKKKKLVVLSPTVYEQYLLWALPFLFVVALLGRRRLSLVVLFFFF